jgi:hypothetical protein
MKYVLPFFNEYVALYSSKYKTDILQNFTKVLNRLAENKEKPISKEEMVELIKLVYGFNPDGKGKQRKRTLQETLYIVNSAIL